MEGTRKTLVNGCLELLNLRDGSMESKNGSGALVTVSIMFRTPFPVHWNGTRHHPIAQHEVHLPRCMKATTLGCRFQVTDEWYGNLFMYVATRCLWASHAAVVALLRCGVNVDVGDSSGHTALYIAICAGSVPLVRTLQRHGAMFDLERVTKMLEERSIELCR